MEGEVKKEAPVIGPGEQVTKEVVQDPLAAARESIAKNMSVRRVSKTLGGIPVEVQTRNLRSILSSNLEDDSPEARVKSLADAVFLPGGDHPLFNSENKEHVAQLLDLSHNKELEEIYEALSVSSDPKGN